MLHFATFYYIFRGAHNLLALVMLNIFMYYTPPQFYPVTCSIPVVSMYFQKRINLCSAGQGLNIISSELSHKKRKYDEEMPQSSDHRPMATMNKGQ